MNKLYNFWYKLTAPHSTDEDEARREYIAKVVLVIVSAVTFAATLVTVIGVSIGAFASDFLLELILLTTTIITAWWLAQRGYWRASGYFLLALIFIESLYTNYAGGVATTAILYYVLLIVLASMLYKAGTQWAILLLCIGAYLVIGWAHVHGYLSLPPVSESDFAFWALNVVGLFVMIVLLHRLSDSQFQRALARSRAYAIELAGEVVERQLTEEALHKKAYYQEQLIETARHLTVSLDVKDVLHRIGSRAKTILDAHGCTIYLLEADGQTLTPMIAIEPPDEAELVASPLDIKTSLTSQAVRVRRGLIFSENLDTLIGRRISDTLVEDEESAIAVPFIADDEALGAMYLNRMGIRFSEEDLALAETFAAYAALALKNAQTYHALQHQVEQHEQAEEALRQSEEKFSRIFRASPDAIIVSSLIDGRYVDVNESFLRATGYRREEIIGYTLADISIWTALHDRIRFVQILQERGSVRDMETSFRSQSGEIGVALMSAEIIDLGGELCLLMISKDITQRKQAERALRRAHDELEQRVAERTDALSKAKQTADEARIAAEQAQRAAESANQAKSVFLANMSHELRTPLNAVLGFSKLMTYDPNLTPDQRANLETINRSGEHLLALINDVLELSKIEAGRVELHEKSFDLHYMLMGLEVMFRLRAQNKGLTLTFDQAADVAQYVRADENKLRQVLINLLGNAVKFTHAGGITLTVKRQAPSLLQFEVQDTGVGIAPDELDAVFDAFVQTSAGRKSQQGTGLGIPISSQFVRMMGGEITVSSPPPSLPASAALPAGKAKGGVGSCFSFAVRVDIAGESEIQKLQSITHRRVVGLEPGQPTFRLLIVEDIATNRELLIKLLSPLGFDLREAVNGREAIEVWKAWDPHLIWMDMRMPTMDGHEATRRIKSTPQGKETIVVALTASAFEGGQAAMLAEGCDGLVLKPIREADIFDALTRFLDIRFVYKEVKVDTRRPIRDGEKRVGGEQPLRDVLATALAAMDPQWLADLHQATTEGDLDWIETLIEQTRERDVNTADTLAGLANDYEHDEILRLIERATADR